MSKKKEYSKKFKLKVVREALKPELEDNLHLVANKYGVQQRTVFRWRKMYQEYGENAFSKGFSFTLADQVKQKKDEELAAKDKVIAELKEELEISKKAAAFLMKLNRD